MPASACHCREAARRPAAEPDASREEAERKRGTRLPAGALFRGAGTRIGVVLQDRATDPRARRTLAKFYLARRRRINNWDLVDSSAPHILGHHLLGADRTVLHRLARSNTLWDRRIAIIATAAFIREGEYRDTLRIAATLLRDTHDLIHKAVGWMLREVGNRSPATGERFLRRYAPTMPRTMLRYAIEKFPPAKRKLYLGMRVR